MATINTNLIVPEVYSALVLEKIAGATKVAQCAVEDPTLMGQAGDTVNIDTVSYIGDATDWNMTTAMVAKDLKESKKPVTIKAVAAPAVKIHDYDSEVALGNKIEDVTTQQAISIARKHDTDAINACLTSPLKFKLATKNHVTQDEMLSILAMYGDERDAADFAEICVSSLFANDFYKMDLFTSLERTTAAANNGIVVNGQIGVFLGIPVVMSDRCYDAANTEGFILVIKKNSLKEVPKEVPFVEVQRDASTRTNNVFCSQFYAVALADETGVVYAKTVTATA